MQHGKLPPQLQFFNIFLDWISQSWNVCNISIVIHFFHFFEEYNLDSSSAQLGGKVDPRRSSSAPIFNGPCASLSHEPNTSSPTQLCRSLEARGSCTATTAAAASCAKAATDLDKLNRPQIELLHSSDTNHARTRSRKYNQCSQNQYFRSDPHFKLHHRPPQTQHLLAATSPLLRRVYVSAAVTNAARPMYLALVRR